jgi:hypothetical protein
MAHGNGGAKWLLARQSSCGNLKEYLGILSACNKIESVSTWRNGLKYQLFSYQLMSVALYLFLHVMARSAISIIEAYRLNQYQYVMSAKKINQCGWHRKCRSMASMAAWLAAGLAAAASSKTK